MNVRKPLFLTLVFLSFSQFIIAQSMADSLWQKMILSRPKASVARIDSLFTILNNNNQEAFSSSEELLDFFKPVISWADQQPNIIIKSETYLQLCDLWALRTYYQPNEDIIPLLEKACSLAKKAESIDLQSRILYLLIYYYGQVYKRYDAVLPFVYEAEQLYFNTGIRRQIRPSSLHNLLFIIADYYYQIQQHDKAINFFEYSLNSPQENKDMRLKTIIYNNMALCYKYKGKYEQAIEAYKNGLAVAEKNEFPGASQWESIIVGSIGDVYAKMGRWKEAIPLLEHDIENSISNGEPLHGYLSLHTLAGIAFKQNNMGEMQQILLRADTLYQNSIYPWKKDVLRTDSLWYHYYEATQQWEKALVARERYIAQHDSIIQYWRIPEVDKFQVQQQLFETQEARKVEILKANRRRLLFYSLTALLLIAMSWLTIRYLHARKKAQQAAIELEKNRQELDQYIKALKEKSRTAEQLEHQLRKADKVSDTTIEPAPANEETLTRFTILTEEDWEQFKIIFNKVHNNFLQNLTKQDIPLTPAEIRLLALLKLNLNNREIAASLAISPDTVKKYKQRLRRKLRNYTDLSIHTLLEATE